MSGSAGKPGVAFFRYETRVEPEIPGQKLMAFGAGGIRVDKLFHRYMTDSTTKTYFGYDLSLERQADGTFTVEFLPFSVPTERLGLTPAGVWTQIQLPRLPGPQIVRARDTIALDLFVQPATGQKIVDYLTFEEGQPAFRLPSGAPRNYTVEDVPLTLAKIRLSMNGKQLHEFGGAISGEAVYFYIPGHGRFIMSLAPNEQLGFRKAGEVRGSRITLTWGSDNFVVDCDGPIAPGGGVFNLYVYPDPTWRPRGNDEFHLGASDARSFVRPRK